MTFENLFDPNITSSCDRPPGGAQTVLALIKIAEICRLIFDCEAPLSSSQPPPASPGSTQRSQRLYGTSWETPRGHVVSRRPGQTASPKVRPQTDPVITCQDYCLYKQTPPPTPSPSQRSSLREKSPPLLRLLRLLRLLQLLQPPPSPPSASAAPS